jgi:hypothetical protein
MRGDTKLRTWKASNLSQLSWPGRAHKPYMRRENAVKNKASVSTDMISYKSQSEKVPLAKTFFAYPEREGSNGDKMQKLPQLVDICDPSAAVLFDRPGPSPSNANDSASTYITISLGSSEAYYMISFVKKWN